MLVAVLFGLTRFGLNQITIVLEGIIINHKKFNVSSIKVVLRAYSIKRTGKSINDLTCNLYLFKGAYQRYVNFLNDEPKHSVTFKPGQEDKVRAFWLDKK